MADSGWVDEIQAAVEARAAAAGRRMAFLRAKLGGALEKVGVKPHLFERAEVAVEAGGPADPRPEAGFR